MTKFRKPQGRHRNQPRPQARDLIVGHDNAKNIHRGKTKLHLRPIQPRDHHKRYTPGHTLTVRAFVGGPTWCRTTIITADRMPLNQALTLEHARLAGHRTSTDLQDAYERSYGTGRTDRIVWVISFLLDATEPVRLLATTGDTPSRYSVGPDNRWRYQESTDERESDRGYTSVASRALKDELPALTDDDHKRHVERNQDMTHGQWRTLDKAREQAAAEQAHAERGRMFRRAA